MNAAGATVFVKTVELIKDAPRDLANALKSVAAVQSVPLGTCKIADIEALLRKSAAGPLLNFSEALAQWDYVDAADWTGRTPRNTERRRELIYDLLRVPASFRKACSARFPVEPVEGTTVIAREHEEWTPVDGFYWNAYRRYLAHTNDWEAASVAVLDEAAKAVVRRLSNPVRREAYRAKGLVVGYVQSGKTANFTGVIAKAIDNGYRFIIVLGGTLDVLRSQTQRRIDKELVGQELLNETPGGNEYTTGEDPDRDWEKFQSHKGLPSTRGSVDIRRLTTRDLDYQRLKLGLDALEFEQHDKTRPLNDPENLKYLRVRLAVVKKNALVLKKLNDDIEGLKETRFGELPVLIIDDESDQASINTRKPSEDEKEERTATNREITRLLKLLPRSQYVGYTATPFANVFVNPADKHDIFPKDFIVSLARPKGYMGVAQFFDTGEVTDDAGPERSSEKAFVRPVKGDDGAAQNFQRAMDSFVLSGAIKLYRQERSSNLDFKHHTMLVHSSTFKAEHKETAAKVIRWYKASRYGDDGSNARLEELLGDFRKVSLAREPSLGFPPEFKALKKHVRECNRRILEHKAVRIVNGDFREDTPNFDAEEGTWSILVGGTKLSRGYTIEGLTTSYYRRTSSTVDTLMQMGRWFGFRKGYGDLVRLFIGTEEPIGKSGRTLNLLEAFKALCLDEEGFRKDLEKYSKEPGITPAKVRPLVPFHMLKPTAKNKMRWARLAYENLGGDWREKTSAPATKDRVRQNEIAAIRMLERAKLRKCALEVTAAGKNLRTSAIVGELKPAEVLEFLVKYRWAKGQESCLSRELTYLKASGSDDPGVRRWLLVAPQLLHPEVKTWKAAGFEFTVKKRTRVDDGGERYKVYSEPSHRDLAEVLAGITNPEKVSRTTQALLKPETGVLLFYPVRDTDRGEKFTSMGFGLMLPPNGRPKELRYGALDEEAEEAA